MQFKKDWSDPIKKINYCVCGNETKSRKYRLSDEGSYEIFCKDCRDLGLQE